MNVNMEKGTIIPQTVRQLAAHGKPFTREADPEKFYDFTRDIIATFPDPSTDISAAEFQEKCDRLRSSSIGSIAVRDVELSNGKIFTTKLVNLGEALNVMPDYKNAGKDVKRIGAIGIILRNNESHQHKGNFERSIDGRLSGSIDILTTGEFHVAEFGYADCSKCPESDLADDMYVMKQIGLSGLFNKTSSLHQIRAHATRSQNLRPRPIEPQQAVDLQHYLLDAFPIK